MCIAISDEIDDEFIGFYKSKDNALVCIEKKHLGEQILSAF